LQKRSASILAPSNPGPSRDFNKEPEMTDIHTPSAAPVSAKPRFGWAKRLMIGTAVTLSLTGLGTAAVYAKDMHPKGGPGQHSMEERAEFMEFRFQKMLDRIGATEDQKTKLTALFEKTREAMKPPAPPAPPADQAAAADDQTPPPPPPGAEGMGPDGMGGPGMGGPGMGGPGMGGPGMGPLPREIMAELVKPTIDKAAIEKMRADKVGELDAKSKILTSALVEAAEILTPEQREKLAAQMAKHDGMRMGMGKGHHKQ
jgi:Spy/CpxP family protein refolding chaperone